MYSISVLNLKFLSCYRPQTKFAKVMFSQVLSVHRGGVCPIACLDTPPGTRGRHNPGQTPPWARHPPCRHHLPVPCMLGYGQQAGGTHPTGMHSCFLRRYVYSNKTIKIFTTQNYCLTKLLLYERWILYCRGRV